MSERALLASIDTRMDPDDLMRSVVEFAESRCWLVYKTPSARRLVIGVPDVVLIRIPRVVFAEFRRESRRPKGWARTDAANCCDAVESYRWCPSDWSEIEATLQ